MDELLDDARALAESLMTDLCVITRAAGEPVFDPVTGNYVDPPPTTVYAGKCRVKPTNVDRTADIGDVRVHFWHSVVSVPISAVDIAVNDRVKITASGDAALVDKVYTVGNIDEGSQITARRLGCDQESS